MQQVAQSLEKKSSKVFLVPGVLGLLLALAGLVTAYYYSWRLTAPGLPVEMRPSYELMAKSIGFTSLAVGVVSLVLIGLGIRRWSKRKSSSVVS
jgi:hypothetical protein